MLIIERGDGFHLVDWMYGGSKLHCYNTDGSLRKDGPCVISGTQCNAQLERALPVTGCGPAPASTEPSTDQWRRPHVIRLTNYPDKIIRTHSRLASGVLERRVNGIGAWIASRPSSCLDSAEEVGHHLVESA